MSVYCPNRRYPRKSDYKPRKRHDRPFGLGTALVVLVLTLGLFYFGERSSDASIVVSKQEITDAPQTFANFSKNIEELSFDASGRPRLNSVPELDDKFIFDPRGYQIELTVDDQFQNEIERSIATYELDYASVVALNAKTGEVISLVSKAKETDELPLALRANFPAASLFKVVTAAAVIEESGMDAESLVYYRGGDYTLNRANYLPDAKRDKRKISLNSAMAKSCNPAFARLALNELSENVLEDFAERFALNRAIPFDFPIPAASFPTIEDEYSLARVAAGFGDVLISPLHAAMIAQTVANGGETLRPYIVKSIQKTNTKEQIYKAEPVSFARPILPSTANELTQMMIETTSKGTAKKQFRKWRKSKFKKIQVAGKTGTLTGENPKGRYHWFIANAPAEDPEISLAALVIDTGDAKINGSALGRLALESYFSKR